MGTFSKMVPQAKPLCPYKRYRTYVQNRGMNVPRCLISERQETQNRSCLRMHIRKMDAGPTNSSKDSASSCINFHAGLVGRKLAHPMTAHCGIMIEFSLRTAPLGFTSGWASEEHRIFLASILQDVKHARTCQQKHILHKGKFQI